MRPEGAAKAVAEKVNTVASARTIAIIFFMSVFLSVFVLIYLFDLGYIITALN